MYFVSDLNEMENCCHCRPHIELNCCERCTWYNVTNIEQVRSVSLVWSFPRLIVSLLGIRAFIILPISDKSLVETLYFHLLQTTVLRFQCQTKSDYTISHQNTRPHINIEDIHIFILAEAFDLFIFTLCSRFAFIDFLFGSFFFAIFVISRRDITFKLNEFV